MTLAFLKSAPGAEPVIVEGLIAAPVSRVYRAWTDPEDIGNWFGLKPGGPVSAKIDLRVGGRWRFVMSEEADQRSVLEGEYLRIEQDRCLAFTWRHVRESGDGTRDTTAPSQVTVTFWAEGAATHMHLRHEGIVQEDGRRGVGHGWEATFGHLTDWLASGG
ncbi:MAG: SRPBCC domain-containing protein [Paracoccaceae bacterium]|nr:SRPBCC domain-containing protein [Paracoccaceae bacterium]